MHKDIRDAILLQMYKTYQVKHPDDDSYVDSYRFSFLYIHLNEAINHLTQPHGTQSPILLDELAVGGYLRKDKCNYYLTTKALSHLSARLKHTSKDKKETKTNTYQQKLNSFFRNPYSVTILGGLAVLFIWQKCFS